MSIGLLVDFLLHVLLRFYEGTGNRVEKTVEMLHTMGSSVLIGGITTCTFCFCATHFI
jgi:predicted RND superfamily exporter protein